jgi:hypothetical protein
MSTKTKEDITKLEDDNDDDSSQSSDSDDDERGVPIDLSENEVYKGVCTLLEDEDGNNILEYISLLHTELIGINKSMENLRQIRKDISRLADCAELFVKGKKTEQKEVREQTVEVTSSKRKSK